MTQHTLSLQEPFLLLLIGTPGSGKSSFTNRHFRDTEIISEEYYQKKVSDHDSGYDDLVSKDAHKLCTQIIQMRLSRGLSVVIDATNTDPKIRQEYLEYANKYEIVTHAMIFLLPLSECIKRNALRTYRAVKETQLRIMHKEVEDTSNTIQDEGFASITTFRTQEEINNAQIKRPEERSLSEVQYDFIGDIHSSLANLISVLHSLGYVVISDMMSETYYITHPQGRKIVFLPEVIGDPKKNPKINRFVHTLVEAGKANLLK